MITKNEAKYIQSLTHKKNRDASGCFIAETPKLVNELLKENVEIKKIYTTDIRQLSHNTPVDIIQINEKELQRISNLQTPNTTVAIAEKKILPPLILENKISLALDGIQDPGNLGTIIRIADWFGIDTIIASHATADSYNPKVVQASMGSIARVNIYYDELAILLQQQKINIYGALLQGQSIYTMSKIKEGIIIIGNEANGISQQLMPFIKHSVTIPAKGCAESLNAAVATGIIVSHLTGVA